MKKMDETLFAVAGVYKIENTETGQVYIGQTKDISTRWNDHENMLKNGTHYSKKMQRSYDLAKDKDIFTFTVLEEVTDEKRRKIREQYYIEKYNSIYNGYNSAENKIPKRVKEKDLKRIYYYNLFAELYLSDVVHFGRTWTERMLDKKKMHYSDHTMRKMCIILKWFYDNYDIYDGYKMHVTVLHNSYSAIISKDDKDIERYFFGTDKKKIYRPDVDMTGLYTGETDWRKFEIPLTYEDCLKKWKPIDQLKYEGTNQN